MSDAEVIGQDDSADYFDSGALAGIDVRSGNKKKPDNSGIIFKD